MPGSFLVILDIFLGGGIVELPMGTIIYLRQNQKVECYKYNGRSKEYARKKHAFLG